jgi:hypothetical protein
LTRPASDVNFKIVALVKTSKHNNAIYSNEPTTSFQPVAILRGYKHMGLSEISDPPFYYLGHP